LDLCEFCGKDSGICKIAGGWEVCISCYTKLVDRNASWDSRTTKKELQEAMERMKPLPLSVAKEEEVQTV
jgi:hypothetical protein